jgi:hypothetical protein
VSRQHTEHHSSTINTAVHLAHADWAHHVTHVLSLISGGTWPTIFFLLLHAVAVLLEFGIGNLGMHSQHQPPASLCPPASLWLVCRLHYVARSADPSIGESTAGFNVTDGLSRRQQLAAVRFLVHGADCAHLGCCSPCTGYWVQSSIREWTATTSLYTVCPMNTDNSRNLQACV